MTKTTKLALAVALAGTLALAFVVWRWRSVPPTPTATPGSRGGTLVCSTRAEPRSFNRYVVRDSTSDLVTHLTHAKLVRINRVTQQEEPWLAESWTASDDGLTYTFRLREGVSFSDGRPFTSADVLFSFRAVYDERTASAISESLRIQGKPLELSAPDARTVIVKFPSPFGPGVRLFDNIPILPRHRLDDALQAGKFKDAWGLTTPPRDLAGLGPFVLADYKPGQRLVFARNPRYWRRDAAGTQLPYLDRLVIEILPDQNAETLRLETGQIDCTHGDVRPDDYAALKRLADAGRLQLVDLGISLDPNFLWFDLRPQAKAKDPRRDWLQSVDFRRAVSHAVDREAFANTVYLGAGEPVHGPITPGNRLWYSPTIRTYEHDPARARVLLAGLGLTDRDGDGKLEDRKGAAVRFSLLTQRGHTPRERSAAVLQQDLGKIGLSVDVVALEPNSLIDRFTKGDYDAVYFGVQMSDTDPAVNLDFWLSSGAFHAWNPSQPKPAADWERQIDELMHRQITTTDRAERQRLFGEVQRIFSEQVPAIYFVAPRLLVAMSTRVANAKPALLRPHVLWNAEELAVK